MTTLERKEFISSLKNSKITIGKLMQLIPNELCYERGFDRRYFYPTIKYLYGRNWSNGKYESHCRLYFECEHSESVGEYEPEALVLPKDTHYFCGSGENKLRGLKEAIINMLEYLSRIQPRTFDLFIELNGRVEISIGQPFSVWIERKPKTKKVK